MTHALSALWQGAALAFGVAALLRCSRRLNASTRYLVWWTALIAVAALTSLQGLRAWADASPVRLASPMVPDVRATLTLPSPPAWCIAALSLLWAGYVVVSCARLLLGLTALRRLRRGARPLAESVAERLPLWSDLAPADRRAALMVSGDVPSACAIGLSRRPLIVLSEALVARLAPQELDLIVMHERAHLVRRDDWTQALQGVVIALFGAHPAVRFIGRRLSIEREMACDDVVVGTTARAPRYAACLALAAEVAGRNRWSPSLLPSASARGTLLPRVQRLLDRGINRSATVNGTLLAMATGALAAATAAGASLSPLVVVASDPISAVPMVIAPPRPGASPDPGPLHAVHLPTNDGAAPRARTVPASVRRDVRPARANPDGASAFEPDAAMSRQGEERSAPAVDAAAPLPSTVLVSNTPVAAPAAPRQAPLATMGRAWTAAGTAVSSKAAALGAATGSASSRTGRAIGGFFGRSARSLAGRFVPDDN